MGQASAAEADRAVPALRCIASIADRIPADVAVDDRRFEAEPALRTLTLRCGCSFAAVLNGDASRPSADSVTIRLASPRDRAYAMWTCAAASADPAAIARALVLFCERRGQDAGARLDATGAILAQCRRIL